MKDAGRWEVESEGTATKSRRRVLQEAAGEKKVGLDLDWSLRTAGYREYTGTLSLHMVLGFRHSIELAYRTLKLLKSLFQIHPFWSSLINNPGALMDCFNAFIFYQII